MSGRLVELDWQQTRMGEISLRRRADPVSGVDVYEVKLGDEFLMSSLFPVAEVELANLGLAAVDGDSLSVLVGGLGLGYTAEAALAHTRVESLLVIETLEAVIDWHTRGLLPCSAALSADPRCTFRLDDFFALVREEPVAALDAILLDIDHSPRFVLNAAHADLYTPDGLACLARHLRPGGVFAMWSDDAPDDEFVTALRRVFVRVDAHVVSFDNPITGGTSANTVYVAVRERAVRLNGAGRSIG